MVSLEQIGVVHLAGEALKSVQRFFQVARRDAAVTRREQVTSDVEARYKLLIEQDQQIAATPAHGMLFEVGAITYANWITDDLVNIPFAFVLRNSWVHPVTVRMVLGKLVSGGSVPMQPLPPFHYELIVEPLNTVTIEMPYRWQPSVDPIVGVRPNENSVLQLQVQLEAYFVGHYGDFVVRQSVQPTTLVWPRQDSDARPM